MRPEDIRRIRKRIDTTLSNFRSVYGCYVNAAGETVTNMEIPVLDMGTEEREMYAAIFKKVLSGKPQDPGESRHGRRELCDFACCGHIRPHG